MPEQTPWPPAKFPAQIWVLKSLKKDCATLEQSVLFRIFKATFCKVFGLISLISEKYPLIKIYEYGKYKSNLFITITHPAI